MPGMTKAKVARMRVPGPGSHDIPSFLEARPLSKDPSTSSYSFPRGSTAREASACKKVPLGPGAHHPRFEVFDRSHGGNRFGRQRRLVGRCDKPQVQDCRASTPGPELSQGDNPNYRKAPEFSFGTEEKKVLCHGSWEAHPTRRRPKTPGPADHNPDDRGTSRWACSPSYSATPRRGGEEKPVQKVKGPGPGSYVTEEVQLALKPVAPRATFGTTARHAACDVDSNRKGGVPGPGRYSTTSRTRTGHGAAVGTFSSPAWSMPGRGEIDLSTPYV
eukprot:TRINITY_DN11607_c0_g1_i1.p1 TRINITY_DN11607_c0_g1~~TRINITY_DN11607_c0_g1_i1.p1  ORF type:complete len:274 (-),score=17.17 TRINITY_DN11607_c0_g1_i1:235-1056(-)